MYLFFDVETTGLPKNWRAPVSHVENWPRVVQLAWDLVDRNTKTISRGDFIIKPEGFTIPNDAINIHKITNEIAKSKGVRLIKAIKQFQESLSSCNLLIAHNIDFDTKVLGAEYIRKNLNYPFENIPSFCTQKSTTDYCKLPGFNGYKWPKLTELHELVFRKRFKNEHNAMADVEACKNCFFKLKELNVI